LHAAGVRLFIFHADYQIERGVLGALGYGLTLASADRSVAWVDARNVRHFDSDSLLPEYDESPNYRVQPYFKQPSRQVRIRFTPAATVTQQKHALGFNTACIWGLRACETLADFIPEAWHDYQEIKASTDRRLRSSDPCPTSILGRRARDADSILLVSIDRVYPRVTEVNDEHYQIADYKLLRILKGRLNRQLKEVAHSPDFFHFFPTGDSRPSVGFHRGEQLLMFSDNSGNIDRPCEVMPATTELLKNLEQMIASEKQASLHFEGDD